MSDKRVSIEIGVKVSGGDDLGKLADQAQDAASATRALGRDAQPAGQAVQELGRAADQGADAAQSLAGDLGDAGTAAKKLSGDAQPAARAVGDVARAADQGADHVDDLAGQLDDAGDAAKQLGSDIKPAAQGVQGLGRAADQGADAAQSLADDLQGAGKAAGDVGRAAEQGTQAVQALADDLGDAGEAAGQMGDEAQPAVSALEKMVQAAADANKATQALTGDLDDAGTAAKKLTGDAQPAARAMEDVAKAADKGADQVDELADDLDDAGDAAKQLGADAKPAAQGVDEVGQAAERSGSLIGKLTSMVAAAGAAIASYFTVRAFAGGIQSAAEFEQAMSRVQAATGAAAGEMEALTKAAQDAGASTSYSSTEAAAALENLAKAGLSAGQAIETLPAVLALAAAGDVELAQSAEYVTKAVQGMGLQFADAARVADVLALGANATNTSVEGLAQALSYAAPVANSLGLSLESTVAIIGKFADAGIDASRAGTALNSILSQFSDPASKFREELGAIGIVTEDFEEALYELAGAGDKGKKAVLAVGMEAGPALRALLGQGIEALDGLIEQLHNAQGSAADTAATMSNNLAGAMTSLASVWDAVVQTLNTPVLDVVRRGVEQITQALRHALSSGTVAQFGDILADAFERAREGVSQFIGALDVTAVIEWFRSTAQTASEALGSITAHATNASNVVKLLWNIMAGGSRTVMAAIYLVAGAVAEMGRLVQEALAGILDGLSHITFGGVAESFRQMAEDVRASAAATGAVVEGFGSRARAALDDAAENAYAVREAWAGLQGQAQETSGALNHAADSARQAAGALEDLGDAAQGAGDAARDAARAHESSADAAADVAQEVARLREEYAQLVASGDLQGATERMQDINLLLGKTSASAKEAAKSASLLDQAYKTMGMKTREELKATAEQARAAFARIKGDAKSTPQEVARAWKVMAEAVIEAAGGVAPAWLQAQAAAHGFTLETNELGEVVVRTKEKVEDLIKTLQKLGGNGKKGGKEVKQGMDEAAEGAEQAEEKISKANFTIQKSFLSAHAQASKWREEAAAHSHALEGQMQSMQGRISGSIQQYFQLFAQHQMLLTKYADEYVSAMERIDAQMQAIERGTSGSAKGVEDLRMRLLELNGTEEQIAKARQQREQMEIERNLKLLELEIERARIRNDRAAEESLQAQLRDLREQLDLLGQIHAAEDRNRRQREQERREQERERQQREREWADRQRRQREEDEWRRRNPPPAPPAPVPPAPRAPVPPAPPARNPPPAPPAPNPPAPPAPNPPAPKPPPPPPPPPPPAFAVPIPPEMWVEMGGISRRSMSAGAASGAPVQVHRVVLGSDTFDVPTTEAGGMQLERFLRGLERARRSAM